MSQADFTRLDAAILSLSKHIDFHEAQILALIALGIAQGASLTASAALTDLANRAGPFS